MRQIAIFLFIKFQLFYELLDNSVQFNNQSNPKSNPSTCICPTEAASTVYISEDGGAS